MSGNFRSTKGSKGTVGAKPVYHVIGTVGAKPTKKKRGPITRKALEKTVSTSGRIVIDTDGDGHIVSGGKSRTYSGHVGALIRDRVPMLWSD